MSEKHKKVCTTLDYIKHFLILASTVTRCISISAFASLLGIHIGITSSATGDIERTHRIGVRVRVKIDP